MTNGQIAWKYEISAYADHASVTGVVLNKSELSAAIPSENVTWTPLYDISGAPRVVSEDADFERMTWTFEIDHDCRVAAGTYALVWMPPNASAKGPGGICPVPLERRVRGNGE